jgi:hypothetical protein
LDLKQFAGLLAAAALASCNFNATLPKSDPALNAEAKATFADLVAGRESAILARLSSANKPADVKAQIPMLRNMIGHDTAPEPTVTGYQSMTSTSGRFYVVGQDYTYPDRVAHVQTNFVKEGDAWKVAGFNVNVTMTGAPAKAPAA